MVIRELLSVFGLKFEDKSFKQADKSIGGMMTQVRQLGQLLAGGVVVAGLARFLNDTLRIGDELDKTSQQIGITTDALQELRHAANLSGVDGAAFAQSLALLQKNAYEAARGSKNMRDDFGKLGVQVKNTDGTFKTADQLLMEVADGMDRLEDSTERTAIALNLMGRSGRRMLPMFKGGRASIEEMRKEARELGGVMSKEVVGQARDLVDNLAKLKLAHLGVKNSIAQALLPWMNKAAGKVVEWAKAAYKFRQGTKLIETALLVLGAAAIVAGVSMLAPFLPAILAFVWLAIKLGLVILVLEDLYQLFTGGESAIGTLIDAIFGIGTAQKVVDDIRLAFKMLFGQMDDGSDIFTTAIEFWIDLFDRLVGAAERAVEMIKGAARAAADFVVPDWLASGAKTAYDFAVRHSGTAASARDWTPPSLRARSSSSTVVAQPKTSLSVNVTSGSADPNAVAGAVAEQVGSVLQRQNEQLISALVAGS